MAKSADFPPPLPSDFRLLPGEQLIRVEEFTHQPHISKEKPSGIREFFRLTSSESPAEVGSSGPAVAALAHKAHENVPEHQGLYAVVFGRDSLRVAIDLVRPYPMLARSTLVTMAELQGTKRHASREEEPGRIVHEARDPDDPIAQRITKSLGWHWPYYGSVDATPEFIRTLSAYCRLNDDNLGFLATTYTDRNGKQKTIADALTRAVNWMLRRMSSNKEGLIEYKAAIKHGIENQVWKDSWDAYHHADGTLANHQKGIASLEVQTVAYDALLDAADLYDNLGKTYGAKVLRRRAKKLRRTVLDRFWTEEKGGYFVLGTDRDDRGRLRQLRVRTSNMGHVLNSHIIEGDDPECARKRNAILHQLRSPELLTPSGIRTLASDEIRFREGAYHNGSVWIWDTHHIAKGIRRHNGDATFAKFADELDERILNVIDEIGNFPEYVRGGDTIAVNTRIIDVRDTSANGRVNRVEQPPQEVQAWTVAAILATNIRRDRRRPLE